MIKCSYCDKEFSKMGIDTHIWRKHGNGKNWNPMTKEVRSKISNSLKGDLNPSKRPEFKKKVSEKIKQKWKDGIYNFDENIKKEISLKIAKKLKGNKNYKYTAGQKIIYKNYILRSSWEFLVAQYLDKLNINWKYEEYSLDLDNRSSYCPDFFIYDKNNKLEKIIEVKGYWTKKALDKMNKVYLKFPNLIIEIWDYTKLKLLNLL